MESVKELKKKRNEKKTDSENERGIQTSRKLIWKGKKRRREEL